MATYTAPTRDASEDDKLGWLKRTKAQSTAWLQTQKSYMEFSEAIRCFEGESDDVVQHESLSNVEAGEIRRNAKELVASLANLRSVDSFQSENKAIYKGAGVLNQLYKCWWYMTRPQTEYKGGLQYAAVMGTGFIGPDWNPDFHGKGRGNIQLVVMGPHQVLPVQLPPDGDYQRAYACHLVHETPIAQAHRKFPDQEAKIIPDRETPSWLRKGMQKIQAFLSPVLEMFGGKPAGAGDPIFPTVDLVYTYIDDRTVNKTGASIQMGYKDGNETLWSYTVPSLGSDIPSGLKDPQTSAPTFRKATRDDCLMYPMRRLIIWCNSGVLYDDTSFWWHGEVPATPFHFDKWIWDALGKPVTHGVVGLEKSMTRIMRAIDDSANTRMDPPLVIAEDVSDDLGEGFSPRIPGQLLKIQSLTGEAVKPLLPSSFYDLPPYIPQYVDALSARIQRNMSVLDATAIAKARQIPSDDTIAKIKEMAGPIIIDVTNMMEISCQKVGEQWKWLAFQFYTVQRRLQLLGDDGVTAQDIDFDPGTLVPSHMPHEDPNVPAQSSRLDRAKWYAGQFYFFIVPGSLHQITQMAQKLVMIQLKKSGVPIDRWTMAEIFNVPNYGPAPMGTSNVMERVQAEQRMMEDAARAMAIAQGLITADGQPGPAAQGAGGAKGGGGPEGRPPSGTKAPHIETKDGGQRSTVAQS